MAITNVGDAQNFSYTGGMQSYTIPISGVYKIECKGAGGGEGGYNGDGSKNPDGGNGGYSVGYKLFNAGQVIYIGVGQTASGGWGNRFNGGRDSSSSSNPSNWYGCRAGAGCTHVATANGELSTLSGNRAAVLIVAGGGGAAKTYSDSNGNKFPGGDGGGTSGEGGTNNYVVVNAAGTQTTGYGFGVGAPATTEQTGSGAGWYGGYSGKNGGGSGGSGYTGGVPAFTYKGASYTPSMTTGGGATGNNNGSAVLTLMTKSTLPVIFNGTTLERIIFNGVEIESLIVNGTKLFMERIKRRVFAWFTSMKREKQLIHQT